MALYYEVQVVYNILNYKSLFGKIFIIPTIMDSHVERYSS